MLIFSPFQSSQHLATGSNFSSIMYQLVYKLNFNTWAFSLRYVRLATLSSLQDFNH